MPRRCAPFACSLATLAAGIYLLSLLGVSLASRERLLVPGDVQRFCGFYLDCHRMVSVETVRYADTVAGARAQGTFAFVTVRLRSDAVGVTLRSGHLAATLRGSSGRTYARARVVERVLATTGVPTGLPDVPLPAGTVVRSTIVFDVSPHEGTLHLRMHDADPRSALTEWLLIGDEDSLLHARTWFALTPPLPSRGAGVRLCGVDSGCDTVARIVDVRRTRRAGPAGLPADGVFYVVTLVTSGTDTGAPVAVTLDAEVRDGRGRSYGRALDVERALPPAQSDDIVRLAFDLPEEIAVPQLVLRKPGVLNRLLERATLPLPGRTALR